MEQEQKQYDAVLTRSAVFAGISPEEIHSMLGCLSARYAHFHKGDFILHHGDFIQSIYLVLEGNVHILKEDFWGNVNLMAECTPGDIFGGILCHPLGCSVRGLYPGSRKHRNSFLNLHKMLTTCGSSCEFLTV